MVALELLAPARNLEIGMAAITHGADAVYIGASQFGAREKAGNSLDDIKALVDFAHQYHARVYVTVNTILYDDELDAAQQLIYDLYTARADAIIVQDLALLDMPLPPIALHASTQMHNDMPQKVQFLEQCGVNRVVLPREFSLNDIADLRSRTSAELEFFVHGALCLCYSGQCYLSQATMGRSANRGACAQLCRTKYSLVDDDGGYLIRDRYLMSLKDLNLSGNLQELIDAGITSFKIEGRLKDAAYVKNITAYYSTLLNRIVGRRTNLRRQASGRCTYTFTPDPERSFNRGFSGHFVNGRQKGMSSFSTPKSMGKPLGQVVARSKGWFTLDSPNEVHRNDGLCYFSSDGELIGFLVSDVRDDRVGIPPEVPMPDVGQTIFRNSDHQFERRLQGQSAQRLVGVHIVAQLGADGPLVLSAADEDGIAAQLTIDGPFEPALKPEQAIEMLRTQLSKAGGTIFQVLGVDTSACKRAVFMATSTINEARRQLLQQLLEARIEQHPFVRRDATMRPTAFYSSAADYRANIANAKSRSFLQQLGVDSIRPAFELAPPPMPCQLVVSKFCIKFELGMCPRYQGAAPTGQLHLEDRAHRYRLEFDCGQCLMKITDIQSIPWSSRRQAVRSSS